MVVVSKLNGGPSIGTRLGANGWSKLCFLDIDCCRRAVFVVVFHIAW